MDILDKIYLICKELAEAPSEFLLLPYGKIELEGTEPVYNDDEGMDAIITKFKSRGIDLVIDYEHQTLKDVVAPAAGWIKNLINRGKQGLWAQVEWTVKAKDFLSNKQYRYFSPVFLYKKSNKKIVEIQSVALTNTPRINSLTPIVAKATLKGDISMFDEMTLTVAKAMGVSSEDLMKYDLDTKDTVHENPKDIQKEIAKMLGISEEDTAKYGASHIS